MKALKLMMMAAIAAVALAAESQAEFVPVATYNIAPALNPFSTPVNTDIYTGQQTGQPQIDAAIAPIMGSDPDDIFLYKQNVGGTEEGSFAGDYTTTFSNTPNDPASALITWNNFNADFINHLTTWLLVKDGNQNPAWYLFDISGWNGMDTLSLSGFWPQQGAISHVSLYGEGDNVVIDPRSNPVPEPSSLVVALSMVGLGAVFMRRRKMQASAV